MPEHNEPKPDFSEVLLAMDVVDTLRHERSLVERELQSEDSEKALIEKLRRIYAGQGIEVSDETLLEGVRALREERFTYRPPEPGLKTALARLYVRRGRWVKRIGILLLVILTLWGGYHFLYAGPSEREKVRIAREVGELGPAAVKDALEPGARQKAEALYTQALSALRRGDSDAARDALEALKGIHSLILMEYTLQVVSRPGTPSGVWRHPVDNPAGRNYYLIVEAVTVDGRRLALPVTSEEDGKVTVVKEWGLRVPADIYEEVRRDKAEDGIVDRRKVGIKKRGFITPEYVVPTRGGAITQW
ncbi:DUF6384 family protein [Desulfatiglans anilini]|uniref:DUF6384 family protein n=1 Tax=Desulfatiglans anilini TaxID=90728 RepID=UPI0004100FD9|nr:DUF6384 family protein [Desulfatiglans anilini]